MDVKVEKLTKSYPTPGKPLVVLEDLDLSLTSGDALAITGPSGSGKSTLLHILGTLDQPTEGSVLLDRRDPFGLADRELSRFRNAEIGFIFQEHYLLPQCTVLENVLVPTLVGDGKGDPAARAADLLSQVGLAERAEHRPGELSGGERQRAALARALVRRPGLLLCDEPTGNLDHENARRVGDLLLRLQEEEGCTLVVVTHSAELAERFPRRARLLERKLVETDRGGEVT